MSETIIALYKDLGTALDVIEKAVNAGVDNDAISLVASNIDQRYDHYLSESDIHVDDVQAEEGTIFGAMVGALVSLGVWTIPGLGQVLATGPLAAALAATVGAITGGLAATLINLGVPEDMAQDYKNHVKTGHTLLLMTVDDSLVDTVEAIIDEYPRISVIGEIED
jgi:uncharacterized membrane protein